MNLKSNSKETELFNQKLGHIIKSGEFINGKWIYRFASYQRFGYWAYNKLERKRLLGQENCYIKNKLGKIIPTIDRLKEMSESNNYNQLMKKI